MTEAATLDPAAEAAATEAADVDLLLTERPDLADLTLEQIAPIELRTAGWPESWRDLARSLYITLVTRPAAPAARDACALAAELMIGIAADMGGMQPYINVGSELQRSGKITRVIALLRAYRQDYDRVGKEVGLTARHVRRIEASWLRQERARRQRDLPLE